MNISSPKPDISPSSSDKFYQQTWFWIAVLVVLIIIIFIQHFPFHSKKITPVIPVTTAVIHKQDVPVYLSALGGVSAPYSITVRTQINGLLMRIAYKEGQMVKAGDVLAEIDSRPYQAQLVQYQGQLQRDLALLANAKIDLQRYQRLWRQNAIAKQTLDTQTALVQQYEGTVQLDKGLIQAAEVNLTYCRIISPIDGRVGLKLVDAGNFVQTSDTTGLVIIDSLNPINVIFAIPEDNVPDVLEQMNAGKALTVYAYDRAQSKLLAVGTMLTMDNQIDTTTGTVKVKAVFNNDKNTLFPNQFVNIRLLVKTIPDAIVAPTAAVQSGPQGNYVFVLNHDNTVSIKPVKTGITFNDHTILTSGVMPGQTVIIEGVEKLAEGTHVKLAHQEKNIA